MQIGREGGRRDLSNGRLSFVSWRLKKKKKKRGEKRRTRYILENDIVKWSVY